MDASGGPCWSLLAIIALGVVLNMSVDTDRDVEMEGGEGGSSGFVGDAHEMDQAQAHVPPPLFLLSVPSPSPAVSPSLWQMAHGESGSAHGLLHSHQQHSLFQPSPSPPSPSSGLTAMPLPDALSPHMHSGAHFFSNVSSRNNSATPPMMMMMQQQQSSLQHQAFVGIGNLHLYSHAHVPSRHNSATPPMHLSHLHQAPPSSASHLFAFGDGGLTTACGVDLDPTPMAVPTLVLTQTQALPPMTTQIAAPTMVTGDELASAAHATIKSEEEAVLEQPQHAPSTSTSTSMTMPRTRRRTSASSMSSAKSSASSSSSTTTIAASASAQANLEPPAMLVPTATTSSSVSTSESRSAVALPRHLDGSIKFRLECGSGTSHFEYDGLPILWRKASQRKEHALVPTYIYLYPRVESVTHITLVVDDAKVRVPKSKEVNVKNAHLANFVLNDNEQHALFQLIQNEAGKRKPDVIVNGVKLHAMHLLVENQKIPFYYCSQKRITIEKAFARASATASGATSTSTAPCACRGQCILDGVDRFRRQFEHFLVATGNASSSSISTATVAAAAAVAAAASVAAPSSRRKSSSSTSNPPPSPPAQITPAALAMALELQADAEVALTPPLQYDHLVHALDALKRTLTAHRRILLPPPPPSLSTGTGNRVANATKKTGGRRPSSSRSQSRGATSRKRVATPCRRGNTRTSTQQQRRAPTGGKTKPASRHRRPTSRYTETDEEDDDEEEDDFSLAETEEDEESPVLEDDDDDDGEEQAEVDTEPAAEAQVERMDE